MMEMDEDRMAYLQAPVIITASQRDFLLEPFVHHMTPVFTPPSYRSPPPGFNSPSSSLGREGGPVSSLSAFEGKDSRTTVMLKRIPRKLTRIELCALLSSIPELAGSFDFTHIPWDSSRQSSRGFAFVNFVDPLHVGILADALEIGNVPIQLKGCLLKYARQQGDRESLVELVAGDYSGGLLKSNEWR